MLQAPAHVAVAGENEFGVRVVTQQGRDGFEQQVGAFLGGQPATKQHRRVHGADAIPAFDRAGIDPAIVLVYRHSIIDHPALPIRQIVHPHQFALERATDRNDPIGAIGAMALVVSNARRRAAPEVIAAAAIFG